MRARLLSPLLFLPLAPLTGCTPTPPRLPLEAQAEVGAATSGPAWSAWSEPVNLGKVVNSSHDEYSETLSPDQLSLYFASTRPSNAGLGKPNNNTDIWVSHRTCLECPWGEPRDLGAVINSPYFDVPGGISADGKLLFFNSDRPGGYGSDDIYLTRRSDATDDFGWGPPVNLGPLVNTAGFEGRSAFLQDGPGGNATLYITRGLTDAAQRDIYAVPMTRGGTPLGPAALVAELSDPVASDAGPAVRADGLAISVGSDRAGGLGGDDLWESTRASVDDPWSPPVDLGPPVNSPSNEIHATVSPDGGTLYFTAFKDRGGVGYGTDIWVATRTRIGW